MWIANFGGKFKSFLQYSTTLLTFVSFDLENQHFVRYFTRYLTETAVTTQFQLSLLFASISLQLSSLILKS